MAVGPLEQQAIIKDIARILESEGEIHEREIDAIGTVDDEPGVIGIELEDGTEFFLKIVAV